MILEIIIYRTNKLHLISESSLYSSLSKNKREVILRVKFTANSKDNLLLVIQLMIYYYM